jgi:hypothetical protein
MSRRLEPGDELPADEAVRARDENPHAVTAAP